MAPEMQRHRPRCSGRDTRRPERRAICKLKGSMIVRRKVRLKRRTQSLAFQFFVVRESVRTVPTREMLILPRWRFLAATVDVRGAASLMPLTVGATGSGAGCPSSSLVNVSSFASS